MSLDQLNTVFQIIASCAVVISLVYLALQTRQTARNQQAQMHAMRLQAIREDIKMLWGPDFHHIWMAGLGAAPNLSEADGSRFVGTAYSLLLNFQEQYHEFKEGMINARRWEPSRKAMTRLLGTPGFRAAFHTYRSELDSQFVTIIDAELRGLKSRSEPGSGYARWAELAKGERAALIATP